jgi:hypothetical protein
VKCISWIYLHLLFVRRGLPHFILFSETKSCLMTAETNRRNMSWYRVTTNTQDLYSCVYRTMKIYRTIPTNEAMTVGVPYLLTKGHEITFCLPLRNGRLNFVKIHHHSEVWARLYLHMISRLGKMF